MQRQLCQTVPTGLSRVVYHPRIATEGPCHRDACSVGNLTLNGNAGRTDVELGGTKKEVVDVGLAVRRLMNVRIELLHGAERASIEEKTTVPASFKEARDSFDRAGVVAFFDLD